MQSLSGETGVYSQVCLTPRLLFPPHPIPCEPLPSFPDIETVSVKGWDITTSCFQELLQSEFHNTLCLPLPQKAGHCYSLLPLGKFYTYNSPHREVSQPPTGGIKLLCYNMLWSPQFSHLVIYMTSHLQSILPKSAHSKLHLHPVVRNTRCPAAMACSRRRCQGILGLEFCCL